MVALGIYFYPAKTQYIYADTITRTSPEDECTRHIFLQIEIFTELDMTDEALETVADLWADQIDDRWNGPTDEEIHQAAEDLNQEDREAGREPRFDEGVLEDVYAGNLNAYPILQRIRQELEDKANENQENAEGVSDCAIINCCKIYFHTIIETREPGDDPREGFDQVEVKEAGFRSFVRVSGDGLTGNQGGTSGEWAFEGGDSSAAAHEAGHLMGADDFYSDVEGEDGETHSESHEGHESDLMARRRGWPKGEHITEILRIAGQPCDCCLDDEVDESWMVDLNLLESFAMDAIAGNNCEHLRSAEQSLEDKLNDLHAYRTTTRAKVDAANQIQSRLDEIKKALEDCDDPEDEDLISIPGLPFSFDSNVCQYYGGGTVEVPIGPETPGTSVPPETPGTSVPPETPGSTTPETPEGGTPETPGGSTPVIPEGSYNPELVTPGLIDTIIERHPGIEHAGGVPKGGTFITVEIIELELSTGEPITIPVPEDQQEEEEELETYTPLFIVKAEQTVLEGDQTTTAPVEGAVLKLGFPVPELPLTENTRTAEATDDQHDQEPRHVVTDENGIGAIFVDGFESGDMTAWGDGRPVTGVTVDLTPTKSTIVYLTDPETTPPAVDIISPDAGTTGPPVPIDHKLSDPETGGVDIEPEFSTGDPEFTPTPASAGDGSDPEADTDDPTSTPASGGQTELPESVVPYITDSVKFGNTWALTLSYDYNLEEDILVDLEGYDFEENHYRDKQTDDPYYETKGSWGQPYEDQWAIKHVGFVEGKNGAWRAAGKDLTPVVVAIIDTGLDWNHADFSWDNIWHNPDEIPDNGIDDDMNGYKDDVIGWDFQTNTGKPWDQDGHGTFIAGMIAATNDNGIGIAGINPAAKIMVLKALNDFGHTRASFLAKAIKYATDNGARVINLSVGGKHLTKIEKLAVNYAHTRGVVIVVASGNDGSPVSDYGLSPYEEVIAVGSSDLDDNRAIFSNWGKEVDIAAPGVDVMSLRARRTDFMRHIRNVEYEEQSAYIGDDKRYYRSSGTSFSAPIVAGVASLIFSMNPDLTNVEVKRMILNSAQDIETPGRDQFTGYGLVDAVAALKADPAFEIMADISGVSVVNQDGQTFVAVSGTAAANDFDYAEISIGVGENPTAFRPVGKRIKDQVFGGMLTLVPAMEFSTAPVWTVRVIVIHKNGQKREEWFTLRLG